GSPELMNWHKLSFAGGSRLGDSILFGSKVYPFCATKFGHVHSSRMVDRILGHGCRLTGFIRTEASITGFEALDYAATRNQLGTSDGRRPHDLGDRPLVHFSEIRGNS